ncbi:hypothetical protein DPEC_G00200260 [Dallia pectoralis]|uniref:Uncharacterized protein n=1 Tax=Dallia pectoralis TaxID=75939 RepID=A0ACC2G8G1_DALPE|nr:hypothetical protein DPEC_G00200260 [Dallia pectoralis]
MAEALLRTLLGEVERLQSRLSDDLEPRKLQKTLRKLDGLPMNVDILVETGIGKTVNSFRKHDLVGDLAKRLVAKWKKLVPAPSSERSGNDKDVHGHVHPHGSEGTDPIRKRPRVPSPEERHHGAEDEEDRMMDEEEEELNVYQTPYSPPQHHTNPPQLVQSGGQRGGYLSEGYESPAEEEPEPEPASSPPRKEPRHDKPRKVPGREHNSHGNRDLVEERQRRHGMTSGGRGEEKKQRSVERDPQRGSAASKHSRHATPHDNKKDKKAGTDGRSRDPSDSPVIGQAPEEQEAFDNPTMSFESFLTYDAPTPTKKKKKPGSSSRHSSHHHTPPRPSVQPLFATPASSKESKASKANGSRSKRAEHASTPTAATTTAVHEKRRRVIDVAPILPEIPLSTLQPIYRPLPSIDLTPLSPQRRKGPVSNDAEEDAGFTGRRFNSKMSVYSGSKTSHLPKMTSLYEQCIRVLQNNVDSIDEVGGVPFEILEPVLERCTPEQLYRIEECNQCFIEETDELWHRHCLRDFKRETPQEYETWREMYLRKHDEREERLRMLTQNISSAHANKPKGRQVKMAFVNSVAKPPRDVRRRQEKFGTKSTSTASSTAAAAPIKIRPAASYSAHSAEAVYSSSQGSPSDTMRSSGPSNIGGPSPRDNKPQVKKIAPMMAKTIKAFKNRFSRR